MGRLVATMWLVGACAALVPGAGAAPAVLPQQSGTVDLLTQANVRIDGAGVDHRAGIVADAGDVNDDGIGDLVVGAPGSTENGFLSGVAYVVFGRASLSNVDLAALGSGGFRINGQSGDGAAPAVGGAGDVNGDGRADVLIGAPDANYGGSRTGSAFVVFGKTSTAAVNLGALGNGGFRIDGEATDQRLGASVSGAGDVNGDGRADVLLASQFTSNNGRSFSGSAYVVFGKTTTTPVDTAALGSGGFRIDGAAASDALGRGSGAGDVNGDGRADVIVGATGASNNGRSSSGSAYVVFGKTTTTSVDLAALGAGGFRIDGAAASDLAGSEVSGGGDVNGDGRPDVLVGSSFAGNNGRAGSGSSYVVFGKTTTTTVDLATLGAGGFRIDGAAANDGAGAVAGAGDVNDDGRADVLVSAIADNNGRADSGSVYVVFGKATTTQVDLAALGGLGIRIDGAGAGDALTVGRTRGAADVNGDERPDVLAGAFSADNNGRSGSGSSYVVFGFGEPALEYAALQANAGVRVAHAPTRFERTGTPAFRVTPPLPAGLSINNAGAVVGTPRAAAARTTHTVTMNDLVGQTTATLTVTVDADRIPPRLRIRAAAKQRALKQKRILLRVGCNEPCALRLQGAIVIRGSRAIIPLRSANAPKHKTAQRTLALVLTKPARKRLAGFLAKGKHAKAIVSIRARDRAGNRKTNTRGIIVLR